VPAFLFDKRSIEMKNRVGGIVIHEQDQVALIKRAKNDEIYYTTFKLNRMNFFVLTEY
jgi:hypothetical protein